MNRRNFVSNTLAAFAGLLVLGMGQCTSGAADLLAKLRNVLKAVEGALAALGLLGPLLPDIVHTVRDYLSAVSQFVDDVATTLEDEAKSAAQKAAEIGKFALKVVMPVVTDPKISTILTVVDQAVNLFLSLFGISTTQVQGRTASPPANVPEIKLNESDRRYLATIEVEARQDYARVQQWAERATSAQRSSLTTPSQGDFIASYQQVAAQSEQCVQVNSATGELTPASCIGRKLGTE